MQATETIATTTQTTHKERAGCALRLSFPDYNRPLLFVPKQWKGIREDQQSYDLRSWQRQH